MAVTLAELIILGLLVDWLLRRVSCPGLVGMLAVGVLCGPFALGLMDQQMLAISGDLRQIALIVILLRAGLQLSRTQLNRIGGRALLLAFLPACAEILAITLVAPPLLGLSQADSLLLGTVVAAVSPAVVVPLMLRFLEEQRGTAKAIPSLVLAAASVDDVFVIVLFGVAMNLVLGGSLAETDTAQIVTRLATVPVAIVFGIAIGVGLGWLLHCFFLAANPRATKRVLVMLGLSILLLRLQDLVADMLPFAALLSIMTAGFFLLERDEDMAHEISAKLGKIWILAEILLFTMVGAQVDPTVAWNCGVGGALVIAGGLAARGLITLACLIGSPLNRGERAVVVVSYMPKATVQAAIGGLPLLAMIEAEQHPSSGHTILAVAVLSIILTAAPGAWAINLLGRRFLTVDESQ